MGDEYPIKEVVVREVRTTHVFVRANSDEEALEKAEEFARSGELKKQFEGDICYETDKWSALKEGVINEKFILD